MKTGNVIFSQPIGSVRSEEQFNQLALSAFSYQLAHNDVYRAFTEALRIDPDLIRHYLDIPFLPVEFFRTNRVYAFHRDPEITFRSSGTTGMQLSAHAVADSLHYRYILLEAFRYFYGDPSDYLICALTPSPSDQPGSSLAYMISTLIDAGAKNGSGFYLNEPERLAGLLRMPDTGYRTPADMARQSYNRHPASGILIIGLTYALLDFAETWAMPLQGAIIMETGGMKGRRREMIREEVHAVLKQAFGTDVIHSEYGMTELMSQAYSGGEGRFLAPPWMKVLIRDTADPLSWAGEGRIGGISILDLANWYSCPFIATQDLGRSLGDGFFEVLGRFDHSEQRGCNLMIGD